VSQLEQAFLTRLRQIAPHLPTPEREYKFAPPRRWRFDMCWPAQRVAVELEGGVWSGGRHTRPAGFEADVVKYNTAALKGWIVLRFTAKLLDQDPVGCITQVAEGLEMSLAIHNSRSKE